MDGWIKWLFFLLDDQSAGPAFYHFILSSYHQFIAEFGMNSDK